MFRFRFNLELAVGELLSFLRPAVLGVAVVWGLVSLSAAEPVVGGYVTWWRDVAQTKAIPISSYTHVYHAFVTSDEHGGVKGHGGRVPAKWFPQWVHGGGGKAILSVGGGGFEGFPVIAADPVKRKRFVDELTTIVGDYGYDGLDVDWEFPKNETMGKNWTTLIVELRASLTVLAKKSKRQQPYLITAAVSGSKWGGRHIDAKTVEAHLDLLNVMSYDFTGPWGGVVGPQSTLISSTRPELSVDGSMTYWLNRGVSKEKLVVGLPFYGYVFHDSKEGEVLASGHGRKVSAIGWRELERKLLSEKWTRRRDASAGAVVCTSANGRHVAGIDDPVLIEQKTRWAFHNDYAGVFVWALGHEESRQGDSPLTDAIRRGLPSVATHE